MKTIKKILIIALVLVANETDLFSQSIFTLSGGNIITNSSFMGALTGDSKTSNQPYVTKGNASLTSSDNKFNYNVNLQRYKGWDNEAGDFHIISIYNNNNLLLQLQNRDSWIKIPANLRQFTSNDYFIPVTLSNTSTALIFIGYAYASQPPHLTIVVISGSHAKLVFNEDYFIQQINKTGTTFSMTLRNHMGEWTSEAAAKAATDIYKGKTYKIWLENKVLNFAQQ
jgi:hypothetical protein